MLALLGALREEIADLHRRMVLEEASISQDCHIYQGKYKNQDVLLVQTGLGKERAERATKLVLERYPVTTLISLGFGGALTPEAKVDDIILCSKLHCGDNRGTNRELESGKTYWSDSSLISLVSQRLKSTATRFRLGSSVTVTQPVSGPEAKRKLVKAFGADVADMESYWIAKIASERQIPFLAVRAISDTAEDSLLPFDQILTSDGKWRWQKAALYFISHPPHLIRLFGLYRKARQARKSLTIFVDCLYGGTSPRVMR